MNTTQVTVNLVKLTESVAEELLRVRKDAIRTDWQLKQQVAMQRRAELVQQIRERILVPSGARG